MSYGKPSTKDNRQLINNILIERQSERDNLHTNNYLTIVHMNKLIRKNVRLLLEVAPECRDDDYALIRIYIYQFTTLNVFEATGTPLAKSIERTRRMLQKECPHLRGEKYEARQKHAKVWAKECRSQEKPESIFSKIANLFS